MEQKNSIPLFFTLMAVGFAIFLLDRAGGLFLMRGFTEGILRSPARELHRTLLVKLSDDERMKFMEQQIQIEKLQKENEDLRETLGIGKSSLSGGKLVHASVLSTSRGFIIDKGTEDGVRAGNTVVFKNIFVGKIEVVGRTVSKVLLPKDNNAVLRVRALETNALGLVKGNGESAILSEVILSESLNDGDTLVTIGDVDEKGLGIRPDFLVGTIENIHKSEDQLFHEARVVPLIDVKSLRNVFVVQ